MNWREYEIFMLALCAWREARSETEEGVRAVMYVARNRVQAWGHGWVETITAKNQFSSMSVVGDSQTVKFPASGDAVFAQMLSIAAVIYNGGDDDPTFGALYYWNPASATSSWFKTHIAEKKQWIARIGHHDFYNDRDKTPPSNPA